MSRKYSNDFKAMIVKLIKVEGNSTSGIAERYNIPLKTVESWITKYNKNPNIFNVKCLSNEQQINLLKKENEKLRCDNEILKKTITLLAKKE